MIKPICRDVFFLGRKSVPAAREDLPTARDLRDTLAANRERCVGMAANMIGVGKRIIIVHTAVGDVLMFNPVLLSKDGPYDAEEGCLSLDGTRKAKRWERIEVEYTDLNWKKRRVRLSGWDAQICQHEMDHLEGIII